MARLEGLGQFKNPMTSGIKPTIFRPGTVPQSTMLPRVQTNKFHVFAGASTGFDP
jgi:hypothetical protein